MRTKIYSYLFRKKKHNYKNIFLDIHSINCFNSCSVLNYKGQIYVCIMDTPFCKIKKKRFFLKLTFHLALKKLQQTSVNLPFLIWIFSLVRLVFFFYMSENVSSLGLEPKMRFSGFESEAWTQILSDGKILLLL